MPEIFGLTSAFQTLLVCALKGSLPLLAAWGAMFALRRASASFRHLIWTGALASLLVLPLAVTIVPAAIPTAVRSSVPAWLSNPEAVFMGPEAPVPVTVVDALADGRGTPLMYGVLPILWIAGFGMIFTTFLVGVVRVAGILSRSTRTPPRDAPPLWRDLLRQFGLSPTVGLYRAQGSCIPFTWGAWRPRVVLPAGFENWPEDRLRSVLTHELAHVRRGDWLAQIVGEFCRSLFWFNPLVWFACAELRKESELACDDAALASGIAGPDYAGHVLEVAQAFRSCEEPPLAALAVARYSNLERRFIAMLNPNVNRSAVSRSTAFLLIGAVIVLVSTLAAMQAPGLAGKFFGTVYDPSGKAVPNATVILSNQVAGTKDMTTTSAAGVFEFATMPAGDYTLEVAAAGFRRYLLSGVVLSAEVGRNETVTLELGAVSENIDVIGDSPNPAAVQRKENAADEQQISVGGSVQRTKLRKMERPVYPPIAKSAGIQGSVLLRGVIGKDGTVQDLRVMNAQIDPDLAKAAVEAVSKWAYEPTLLNGRPVAVITEIAVNFALK